MRADCLSFWGHKYEGRFDELPNELRFSAKAIPAEELRRLMIRKRYVRDVCVRCGDTIERGE